MSTGLTRGLIQQSRHSGPAAALGGVCPVFVWPVTHFRLSWIKARSLLNTLQPGARRSLQTPRPPEVMSPDPHPAVPRVTVEGALPCQTPEQPGPPQGQSRTGDARRARRGLLCVRLLSSPQDVPTGFNPAITCHPLGQVFVYTLVNRDHRCLTPGVEGHGWRSPRGIRGAETLENPLFQVEHMRFSLFREECTCHRNGCEPGTHSLLCTAQPASCEPAGTGRERARLGLQPD